MNLERKRYFNLTKSRFPLTLSAVQNTKVIYFDLGKVLVDFDWREAVQKMARLSPVTQDNLFEILTSSSPAMAYELGNISSENFFKWLKEKISFQAPAEHLRLLWSDIFTPIHAHIRIAQALSRRYPLGLISNTNEAHAAHVDSKFHFFKLFSSRVFSFEAGRLKPQRAMYEFAAAQFDVGVSEILLIDDLEANVQGARASGWQAIHYTKDKDLLDELKKLNM